MYGAIFAFTSIIIIIYLFVSGNASSGAVIGAIIIGAIIALPVKLVIMIIAGLVGSVLGFSSNTNGTSGGQSTGYATGSNSYTGGGGRVGSNNSGARNRAYSGKQHGADGHSGQKTGGLNKEGWFNVNAHCGHCYTPLTDQQRNNKQYFCSRQCYGAFRRIHKRTRPDF